MARIDYYFTTVSPYAYLAGARLEEIAARHGAAIRYRPMDLGRVFAATGGLPLPQRSEARRAYRLQELRRQSVKAGLPFHIHPAHWPVNAAPSSYAIIAAEKAGGGNLPGLVQGVLAACWAEERDISDDGVIRDLLAAHGFDPKLATSGLLVGAETYERYTEEAIARGVFGSPFYIVGEEMFWGQDRLEDLDAHLAGRL